ncbi:hypothetical protein L2E82_16951 [Cichorium intybus]|uniref:Uncharacterized protein n=1 Tax=Cichorium intybus TaxID=13427 RepID=A0ACB9F6Y0_CICIN|nr:hypothetical protein L2E82_16951 [Cichorium intybus]
MLNVKKDHNIERNMKNRKGPRVELPIAMEEGKNHIFVIPLTTIYSNFLTSFIFVSSNFKPLNLSISSS